MHYVDNCDDVGAMLKAMGWTEEELAEAEDYLMTAVAVCVEETKREEVSVRCECDGDVFEVVHGDGVQGETMA